MTKPSSYLVITGASRGIGLATVQLFMDNGWQAINLSRSPCPIAGVNNIEVDLATLPAHIDTVKQQLSTVLPTSAVISLVHNAAICPSDTVPTIGIDTLLNTLNLNVVAPVLLNQLLLPLMQPTSSIIYIGTTLAEKAVPGCASYITSKHAVAGLMKATCQDLVGQHIHTCCICPGVTETEMLQKRFKEISGLFEKLSVLTSEQRLIQPHEIADVIWFSATHPVINGAMLHANLGEIGH